MPKRKSKSTPAKPAVTTAAVASTHASARDENSDRLIKQQRKDEKTSQDDKDKKNTDAKINKVQAMDAGRIAGEALAYTAPTKTLQLKNIVSYQAAKNGWGKFKEDYEASYIAGFAAKCANLEAAASKSGENAAEQLCAQDAATYLAADYKDATEFKFEDISISNSRALLIYNGAFNARLTFYRQHPNDAKLLAYQAAQSQKKDLYIKAMKIGAHDDKEVLTKTHPLIKGISIEISPQFAAKCYDEYITEKTNKEKIEAEKAAIEEAAAKKAAAEKAAAIEAAKNAVIEAQKAAAAARTAAVNAAQKAAEKAAILEIFEYKPSDKNKVTTDSLTYGHLADVYQTTFHESFKQLRDKYEEVLQNYLKQMTEQLFTNFNLAQFDVDLETLQRSLGVEREVALRFKLHLNLLFNRCRQWFSQIQSQVLQSVISRDQIPQASDPLFITLHLEARRFHAIGFLSTVLQHSQDIFNREHQILLAEASKLGNIHGIAAVSMHISIADQPSYTNFNRIIITAPGLVKAYNEARTQAFTLRRYILKDVMTVAISHACILNEALIHTPNFVAICKACPDIEARCREEYSKTLKDCREVLRQVRFLAIKHKKFDAKNLEDKTGIIAKTKAYAIAFMDLCNQVFAQCRLFVQNISTNYVEASAFLDDPDEGRQELLTEATALGGTEFAAECDALRTQLIKDSSSTAAAATMLAGMAQKISAHSSLYSSNPPASPTLDLKLDGKQTLASAAAEVTDDAAKKTPSYS